MDADNVAVRVYVSAFRDVGHGGAAGAMGAVMGQLLRVDLLRYDEIQVIAEPPSCERDSESNRQVTRPQAFGPGDEESVFVVSGQIQAGTDLASVSYSIDQCADAVRQRVAEGRRGISRHSGLSDIVSLARSISSRLADEIPFSAVVVGPFHVEGERGPSDPAKDLEIVFRYLLASAEHLRTVSAEGEPDYTLSGTVTVDSSGPARTVLTIARGGGADQPVDSLMFVREGMGMTEYYVSIGEAGVERLDQLRRLNRSGEITSREVAWLLDEGRAKLCLGEYEECRVSAEGARTVLESVVARDPNNPEGLALLGRAVLLDGEVGSAIGLLRRASAALEESRVELGASGEADILRLIGGGYLIAGDNRRAIEFLEQSLEIRGDQADPDLFVSLALAYRSLNEAEAAAAYFHRARELDRGNEQAAVGLRNIYAEQGYARATRGDYDEAVSRFAEAATYRGDAEIYGWLIFLLVEQGKFGDAVAWLDRAIAEEEVNARVYNNGGYAFLNQGGFSRARELFDMALDLDPRLTGAYNGRGWVRAGLGDLEGAIRDYDRAIQLRPDYVGAYVSKSSALYDMGEVEAALKLVEEVREAQPDEAIVHNQEAFLLAEAGRYEEAIEAAERALMLDSEYANALNHMGYSKYRAGEREDGRDLIRRALELNEWYGGAYYNLARLAGLENRKEEAFANLGRAISLRPAYRLRAATEPAFDGLRGEQEFQRLISEAGSESG